jgi:proteasome activator subunit 4
MRRTFITILRTPILLAMFSKDPLAMGAAQGSLHTMALLEPGLIMPEILERAYGGLEVVNETHRTTAVLSALSLVALPLVSERVWLGGQKHVVPLLEMALPGIDLVRLAPCGSRRGADDAHRTTRGRRCARACSSCPSCS